MSLLTNNPLSRRATSLLDEFKAFAFKGNVIDLAIGVIIGGAFGKIVTSLVQNILMPLISAISPAGAGSDKPGYESWTGKVNGVDIPYGAFLGDVVSFLIVAAALFFFVVKFLGWIMRFKQEEAVSPAPVLTKDQELLTEIRNLLAARDGVRPTPPQP
jgi:large conductance mechanosensitive channel